MPYDQHHFDSMPMDDRQAHAAYCTRNQPPHPATDRTQPANDHDHNRVQPASQSAGVRSLFECADGALQAMEKNLAVLTSALSSVLIHGPAVDLDHPDGPESSDLANGIRQHINYIHRLSAGIEYLTHHLDL